MAESVELQEDTFTTLSNPDYTNYTVSASAFTLKKYDTQLLGTDIIFAKASYGIGEKTMGSLNISLIGTFIASVKHQFTFTDDFNFALSASAGNAFYINKDSIGRCAGGQGVFTLGDKQNNFSAGIGLYFCKSTFDVVDQTDRLYFHNVFVATQRQLRRKTYLVAEGMYLWNYNTFLGSVVVKFIIKEKMSLHLGLMPLYRNGRIRSNQTKVEGGLVPVISYRWLLEG